ncbi:chitin synthase chs-2-like [Dendronephthya gigantea]|uniref:chitin synthase chs-2-like n=1 Tax=Dendronephthya gigantea TaxID=151771 RepID=UPI00106B78DB|nr:chitin synthase chs-2-like [Dendronephthya gigantea]
MASSSFEFKLSASQNSRLDVEIPFLWPRWGASVCKWLFTIVVAILTLSAAVASRMALIAIPRSKHSGNDAEMFLALVIVIMVPYLVEFLRSLWLHGIVPGHEWPTPCAIFVGVFDSLLEVFGVCYFTIAVLTLPDLSSTELILYMNAVFILPAFKFYFGRENERFSVINILAYVTVFLDLAALGWGIYKFTGIRERTALPASLVLLNVAWFSPLRKLQLRSRVESLIDSRDYNPLSNSEADLSSTDRLTEFDVLSSSYGRATRKSGVINSAIKLITTPFVCVFFCHFYDVVSLYDVHGYQISNGLEIYTVYIWVNVICSFGVYLLGSLSCMVGIQRQAFAFPLLLVTPVAIFLSSAHWSCESWTIPSSCGYVLGVEHYHVLIIAAMLWLGLMAYVMLYIWKGQEETMVPEKYLFLIPYTYNGVFLEQYLILNREDSAIARPFLQTYPHNQANVFLCTTVYHEDPKIMAQYLVCLSRINNNKRKYNSLETHVVFDDAFTASGTLNTQARCFVNLCKEILNISTMTRDIKMPYGSEMLITLEDGMAVYLHFKDSLKVKQGKRWSQMMIMSWIIDTKRNSIHDPANTYFLTCDVDVSFTCSSIEKLLDLMLRKSFVGAATCRVFAEGSGPVVWYQIYEYAIWHWLVKAANSVFGSLLNCNGCFSVFRLKALSQVIPVFSRQTENGGDYIKKDLGEDRFLSSLLLKSGWVLDYCSLAEVSTLCPETFDGFFQQRRHWIMSSFANTCCLIKDFWNIRHFNYKLSVLFFAYLIISVFFMVISPSVMIWMITGSVFYITGGHDVVTALGITLMALLLLYIAVCMFTLPDVHRAFAKAGSYILAVVIFILALVSLGRVISNPYNTFHHSDDPPHDLDKQMKISVAMVYVIIYVGVFVGTALVYPKEFLCNLQSLWYLLCLPGFNIFLFPYTVVNMAKTNEELDTPATVHWYYRLLEFVCRRKKPASPQNVQSFCCSCCPSIIDTDHYEAVINHEEEATETADKCEGVGPDDDVIVNKDETVEISDEGEDEGIIDVGVSEQRKYWQKLCQEFLLPYERTTLIENRKQLVFIANGSLLVFSLVNILWFIVDYGFLLTSPLGFGSLTLFTAVLIMQYIAMLYHRLMTVSYELSQACFYPNMSQRPRPWELPSIPYPGYQHGKNTIDASA